MTIEEKYNWNKEYSPFTVEELRVLSAKHGMDIAIIIGYNREKDMYNLVTVGKNKQFADNAKFVGEKVLELINPDIKLDEYELLEDKRHEHTN